MDIKNLIIVLLAAALGITALEAINLYNGGHSVEYTAKPGDGKFEDIKVVEPKVIKFITDDVAQNPTLPNPPASINDEQKGIYFSYAAITKLILDEQQRIQQAGSNVKIEGIVVYPYREDNNRINASIGTVWINNATPSITKNPIYLTGETWCPAVCGSIQ
ncbi:MAG: hypothetical protein RJA07_2045 [Bacteroidota bacterium]|jgi:hypothetical protein